MADDDATARPTRKATTGKAAKKAVTKKAGAGAPATKKAPVSKKAAPKKAPASKKAAPKKAAKKASAAKKGSAAPDRGATLAPRKKKAPPLRLAAEQTFDDDWEERNPEPVREDPSTRIRAALREAAQSLEDADAPAAAAPAAASHPAPTAPPPAAEEPPARVLVAPAPADDEEWGADEMEMETQDDVERDEALDDTATMATPATSPERPPARAPLPPTGVVSAPAEPASKKPEKKPRRRLRVLILAIVVIAVVAVAAIVTYSLLREEGVDYSKLQVGDCFDSSPSNEVRGVKVKPCSEPHNSEIFFRVTHPAGPDEPYPGKEALVQFAADACLGQPLTDYLGVPLEQSTLKDFEIVPQESAWKDGRRVLVCGIDTGGEGKITGSVKGTGR